jgi:hypothetical protein
MAASNYLPDEINIAAKLGKQGCASMCFDETADAPYE